MGFTNGPKRKPRQLVGLRVHEVSLVDKPANEIEFALLKRRENDPMNDNDRMVLTDVFAEASSGVAKALDCIAARFVAAKAKDENKKKSLTLNDLLESDEDRSAAGELLDTFEKMFGVSPVNYAFRVMPLPATFDKQEGAPMPSAFNARALWSMITAAARVPGTPDDVKKSFEDVLATLKPLVEASKGEGEGEPNPPQFVGKAEFDALKKEFEEFVAATVAALRPAPPKEPDA